MANEEARISAKPPVQCPCNNQSFAARHHPPSRFIAACSCGLIAPCQRNVERMSTGHIRTPRLSRTEDNFNHSIGDGQVHATRQGERAIVSRWREESLGAGTTCWRFQIFIEPYYIRCTLNGRRPIGRAGVYARSLCHQIGALRQQGAPGDVGHGPAKCRRRVYYIYQRHFPGSIASDLAAL
jgi:hypothetical protein